MLAPAPLQDLSQYLDRWAAARLSCEPADRATAEAGVRLAYHAAGLPPPQRIIWCDSPIDMAERLAAVSRSDDIGVNVKSEVFTSVRDRVGTFAEIFWKEVVIAAHRDARKIWRQAGRIRESQARKRHRRRGSRERRRPCPAPDEHARATCHA